MKRLSKKQRWYLIQNENNKRKRHRTHQNKRKLRKKTKSNKIGTTKISAPYIFSLVTDENRNILLRFLDRVHSEVANNRKVFINFDDTEILEPNGTLFFVAKMEIILSQYEGLISCRYPKNEVVEQLFQHIGLLQKLGLVARKQITADNVIHWHYATGYSTDTSEFKSLFKTYSCKLDEDVSESLYDSMAEAVTNCIMHAYADEFSTKRSSLNIATKEWWMFAQYKDEKLTVVILDLGIGIPLSLQYKPDFKEYIFSSISALKKRKDTELVEIAVQSSRSRTKLKHRGLGLPEMLECVKTGNVGRFLVLSGKGFFYYDAKSNIESNKKRDYEERLPGTLIQWEIEIPSNREFNHEC